MKIKRDKLKDKIAGFAGSDNITFGRKKIISHIDNGEMLIITELKTKFGSDITIPFAELFATLKIKTCPEVLSIESDNGLLITGEGIDIGIKASSDAYEYDEMTDIPEDFEELPEGFKSAIKTALQTTLPNDDGTDYSCIKFEDETIMSTDGLLITKISMKNKIPTGLLRSRHFKHLESFCGWAENEVWVFFKSENDIVYGLRKIESNEDEGASYEGFGDYFEFEGEEVEFPDLLDLIRSANIFTDNEKSDDKKHIFVDVKGGKVFVKGENAKGYSKTYKEIKTDKEFGFVANPERLLNVISHSKVMKFGANDEGEYSKALLSYDNAGLLVELLIGFLEKDDE